eukprot:jgi/Undpi1/13325/HiC_scaffold_8.g02984.m1
MCTVAPPLCRLFKIDVARLAYLAFIPHRGRGGWVRLLRLISATELHDRFFNASSGTRSVFGRIDMSSSSSELLDNVVDLINKAKLEAKEQKIYLLAQMLDKVAHISEKVITQLKALSEFAAEDFFPPVPAGETPLAIPADVHFATFVAAFMETLEYGMEGAQAVCKGRVSQLRGELEAVQKSVEVYLRRHFSNLSPYSAEVRELLLRAMNGGLKAAMIALAMRRCALPGTPVRRRTGVPMTTPTTPTFMRLRELVEEGAAASLRERKDFWRQPSAKAAGSVGGKRKGAAGAGGQRTAPAQGRVGGGGLPASFKARMQDALLPPGCVIARGAGSRARGETVCLPTKSPRSCSRSRSRSRSKPSRCRHHLPRRRNSRSRNKQLQQRGGGGQEGEAEGSAHRASRATVETSWEAAGAEPPRGAERDGALAATDSTGPAIRQGRPKGGQGRKKNG